MGIYPAEIRREIEYLSAGPPPASVYREYKEGDDEEVMGQYKERFSDYLSLLLSALFAGTAESTSFQTFIAHAEFYKLRNITDYARECLDFRPSEAVWHAKVHEPLLEFALSRRHTSHLRDCNVGPDSALLSSMPHYGGTGRR